MLTRDDEGQLTLLVIGYTLVAVVLIAIGVDASKAFLARRALASVADAAAVTAAQEVDRAAVYAGDVRCGAPLPLDSDRAARAVDGVVADDRDDLRHTFADIATPVTSVTAGRVTVGLAGDVPLPFRRVVAVLVPGLPDGRVHVAVTAHAEAPLTAPGGCPARG